MSFENIRDFGDKVDRFPEVAIRAEDLGGMAGAFSAGNSFSLLSK